MLLPEPRWEDRWALSQAKQGDGFTRHQRSICQQGEELSSGLEGGRNCLEEPRRQEGRESSAGCPGLCRHQGSIVVLVPDPPAASLQQHLHPIPGCPLLSVGARTFVMVQRGLETIIFTSGWASCSWIANWVSFFKHSAVHLFPSHCRLKIFSHLTPRAEFLNWYDIWHHQRFLNFSTGWFTLTKTRDIFKDNCKRFVVEAGLSRRWFNTNLGTAGQDTPTVIAPGIHIWQGCSVVPTGSKPVDLLLHIPKSQLKVTWNMYVVKQVTALTLGNRMKEQFSLFLQKYHLN